MFAAENSHIYFFLVSQFILKTRKATIVDISALGVNW